MEKFYTGDSVLPAHEQGLTPPTVEDITQRGYFLTTEEARAVRLSLLPWKRVGQVAAYAKTFGIQPLGASAPISSRRALISLAAAREDATQAWAPVLEAAERLHVNRLLNDHSELTAGEE